MVEEREAQRVQQAASRPPPARVTLPLPILPPKLGTPLSALYRCKSAWLDVRDVLEGALGKATARGTRSADYHDGDSSHARRQPCQQGRPPSTGMLKAKRLDVVEQVRPSLACNTVCSQRPAGDADPDWFSPAPHRWAQLDRLVMALSVHAYFLDPSFALLLFRIIVQMRASLVGP